jgi:hypothetical protein
MMPFTINKTLTHALLAGLLIGLVSVAQAWVTPVELDVDHGDDTGVDVKNTVTTTLGSFDRCDTELGEYTGATPPTQCHRRNLIWQVGSSVELVQWDPELGESADWRLPTIKELARLVNYAASSSEDAFLEQPLITNMFTTLTMSTSWLISSSHRDIDSDPNNGEAQIFGINMGTGEIAAFDTVVATDIVSVTNETVSHASPGSVMVGDVIAVSDSTTSGIQTIVAIEVTGIVSTDTVNNLIEVDGDQTTQTITLKKCDSLNADGACTVTSNASVYALLVHTQTVSDLLSP